MRLLRDTRMEAQQIEDYLRSLNSAYRRAAEPYEAKMEKIRQMFQTANPFRGRMKFDEFIRYYPKSYDALRSVAN
jgi:phage-related tail protein